MRRLLALMPLTVAAPAVADPLPDWLVDAVAVHGQATVTLQATPAFRDPYEGENSLKPDQARETVDATACVANDPVNHTDPTGMTCDRQGTICTSDVTPRSPTTTVQNTPTMDRAMHDNARSVRVSSSSTTEKIGFIKGDKNGAEIFRNPSDTMTGSSSTSDNARATPQPDDIAVLHGHIPGQSEGMQHDTRGGRSLEDAQPLRRGLTNGTVLENRLGVHEVVNGVLQFRMVDERMTSQERRDMQQNLNQEQRIFP